MISKVDWEKYCKMLEQNLNQEIENRKEVEKTLQNFGVMTKEDKQYIADALMFSPKCWKDGKFKFDREPCGKNCFECMYETFGSLVR